MTKNRRIQRMRSGIRVLPDGVVHMACTMMRDYATGRRSDLLPRRVVRDVGRKVRDSVPVMRGRIAVRSRRLPRSEGRVPKFMSSGNASAIHRCAVWGGAAPRRRAPVATRCATHASVPGELRVGTDRLRHRPRLVVAPQLGGASHAGAAGQQRGGAARWGQALGQVGGGARVARIALALRDDERGGDQRGRHRSRVRRHRRVPARRRRYGHRAPFAPCFDPLRARRAACERILCCARVARGRPSAGRPRRAARAIRPSAHRRTGAQAVPWRASARATRRRHRRGRLRRVRARRRRLPSAVPRRR